MFVYKWMSKKVITVDESDSISYASNLLKENNIRRLPVLKEDKLIGIVSDRDIRSASPSKVTSLDIWELHYLMSKVKVKEIMTKKIITISPESTIEKAAIMMHDNKIGGLPVVDSKKKLVGIITEHDVFAALINITGARIAAYRINLIISDEPGSIKDVMDIMRKFKFKCVSILTSYVEMNNGFREVMIRFQTEEDELNKILKALENVYSKIELTKD